MLQTIKKNQTITSVKTGISKVNCSVHENIAYVHKNEMNIQMNRRRGSRTRRKQNIRRILKISTSLSHRNSQFCDRPLHRAKVNVQHNRFFHINYLNNVYVIYIYERKKETNSKIK